MDHSPADIMAQLLVNAGHAVFTDALQAPDKWKIAVCVVPDVPDRLLCVYDTQGIHNGRFIAPDGTIVAVDHPAYQVMARARTHQGGFRKLSRIADYFRDVKGIAVIMPAKTVEDVLITAATYQVNSITRTSPVLSVGQDEKARLLYTLNGFVSMIKIS